MRELDAEIAEKLFGERIRPRGSKMEPCIIPQTADGTKMPWRAIPHYSTNIEDAWMVVWKMGGENSFWLQWYPHGGPSDTYGKSEGKYQACFGISDRVWAKTAPEAICRAALAALTHPAKEDSHG